MIPLTCDDVLHCFDHGKMQRVLHQRAGGFPNALRVPLLSAKFSPLGPVQTILLPQLLH